MDWTKSLKPETFAPPAKMHCTKPTITIAGRGGGLTMPETGKMQIPRTLTPEQHRIIPAGCSHGERKATKQNTKSETAQSA